MQMEAIVFDARSLRNHCDCILTCTLLGDRYDESSAHGLFAFRVRQTTPVARVLLAPVADAADLVNLRRRLAGRKLRILMTRTRADGSSLGSYVRADCSTLDQ